MKGYVVPLLAGILVAAALAAEATAPPPVQAATGTIKGRVKLAGKLPGNSVIRMGVDPKCSEMNKGKQVVQEAVKAAADGSLANAFVRLEGTFPATPAPAAPAVLEQRGCVYSPRVLGVRVGQNLEIRNADNLLHNVHSVSNRSNQFNFGQARAGVSNTFKMKDEEVLLRIGCDIHRWMTAYVGVVNNPYFAVTDAAGAFQIDKVPPGTYTIDVWQERFGVLKKTVKVTAGAVSAVDFSYTGNETPPKL